MGWYGIIRTSPLSGLGHSDGGDSHRLGALGSLLDLELDALVRLEGAEAAALDLGKVHEDILRAVIRGDEAEALVAVEPLHSSLCHLLTSLISVRMYLQHPRITVAVEAPIQLVRCVPDVRWGRRRADLDRRACEGRDCAWAFGALVFGAVVFGAGARWGARSPATACTAAESAVTSCGVTEMPARRSSTWVSLRCSGRTTVTTSPEFPARAVRPDR